MRYVLDVKSENAREWGTCFFSAEKRGELKILNKGDPIEQMSTVLSQIKNALDVLNKTGISKDVMIGYIRSKGIPLSTIRDVLYAQDEFFKKLGVQK